MSNVQLYQQMADTVSPQLRNIVPSAEPAEEAPAVEEFAADVFSEAPAQGAAFSMPMLAQSLRVTGGRPVNFTGRHLAMANGWNNGVARWYEINLYETDGGQIVCDIRLFNKDPDSTDLYRATTHDSWASAVAWLEAYNPAHDMICDLSLDDEALSAAEISLQGIRIRQQMLELRTQYQTTLGNLLYELKLDLGD